VRLICFPEPSEGASFNSDILTLDMRGIQSFGR
jgi:hypothetical protein